MFILSAVGWFFLLTDYKAFLKICNWGWISIRNFFQDPELLKRRSWIRNRNKSVRIDNTGFKTSIIPLRFEHVYSIISPSQSQSRQKWGQLRNTVKCCLLLSLFVDHQLHFSIRNMAFRILLVLYKIKNKFETLCFEMKLSTILRRRSTIWKESYNLILKI